MRTLLGMLLVAAWLFGCGDDGGVTPDGGGAMGDGGTMGDGGGDGAAADAPGSGDPCEVLRETAPNPDQLMGPCCARTDNDAAAPNFRLAALDIASPGPLASLTIGILLADALDTGRFNWLFAVEGAAGDGDVELTTGFARADESSTYSFAMDDAPGSDSSRWNPVRVTGALSGETLSSPPAPTPVILPLLTEEGMVDTELPLNALELTMGLMSEDRNCIGTRTRSAWETSQGEVRAFVTVEGAMAANVEPLMRTLCQFISGIQPQDGTCADVPRTDWQTPPDGMCTETGCELDPGDGSVCDPMSDCNAWELTAGFAAHAVVVQ